MAITLIVAIGWPVLVPGAALADEVPAPERLAPPPAAPPADDPPLVIDLDTAPAAARASRRARVTAALGQHPVLTASTDVELTLALIGELPPAAVTRGTEAAEAALVAAQAGRCVEALASAQIAILDLAGAEAAGASLKPAVRLALTARLRCALAAGDDEMTIRTVGQLRALGQVDPPPGVTARIWERYPELDAAGNVTRAEVTIESVPPGAEVWIDNAPRGVAPVVVHLNQGTHIVAVGTRDGSIAARTINITSWVHKETLEPRPSVGRWTRVNDLITDLRAKRRGADATAIAEVMLVSGANAALVLLAGGTTEVWRLLGKDHAMRVGQRRSESQAVALLASGAKSSRAPDPNIPLLRETDAERKAREHRTESTRWWVYAAVVGAAAIGAGVIVFGQSGTDRQRFEITLP